MRLARVRAGTEILALQVDESGTDGRVLDVGGDDPLRALLTAAADTPGHPGEALATAARRRLTNRSVALGDVAVLAPIARPGKIMAIGLNYLDHTKETGLTAPPAPLVFAKWATSVAGPYDDIRAPRSQTQQLDYEGELCAVIGKRCAADGSADASVVAAYTVGNDVSARDVQFADVQWTRGKSFDTFAPMGPWLVTSDELGDISDVRITTTVNGEKLQDDLAGSMVFDVDAILHHLSDGTTLEPGDVVMTGTPSGAGGFLEPPRFLDDGDVVEVVVARVGALRNVVRDVR
jgi:2-keto-4-pentenoate hydratase/2-oxohepta-3-ene-1,7-dioic acid hydratase in catechol pathway